MATNKQLNIPTLRPLADPEDYRRRLKALMDQIPTPYQQTPAGVVRELFNLHNEYYMTREFGVSCGACRAKVYKKMKKLHDELNGTKEPIDKGQAEGA